MFTGHFWERGTWKDASLRHGTSHNLEGRTEVSRGNGFELSSSGNHVLDDVKGGKKGWEKDLERGEGGVGVGKGNGHKRGKSSTTLFAIGSKSVESLQYVIQGSRVGEGKEDERVRGLEVNVVTSFRVESEMVDGSKIDVGNEQREEEWQRKSGSFVSGRRK